MRFSAMAAATVVVLVVAGAIAYFAVPQSTGVNVAQAATTGCAGSRCRPDRPAAGIAAPAGSDGAECSCATANRFASPCPGPNRDLDIR